MKIVFLGDSLTASAEVTIDSRWTYLVGLANGYLPSEIINAGVSGNTSTQMLARLQADVLFHNPDVCVLMLTVNDRTNNFTIAKHESNYRNIIEQLKGAGIKVVVMSPPLYTRNLDLWRPWVEKGEEIAGDTGCHYIDCWREFVYASYYLPNWYPVLYKDYVHQTAAGNALIASVCARKTHTGAFIRGVAQPPEQPPVQCGCSELTLALADLQANGATAARLSRVSSAL